MAVCLEVRKRPPLEIGACPTSKAFDHNSFQQNWGHEDARYVANMVV